MMGAGADAARYGASVGRSFGRLILVGVLHARRAKRVIGTFRCECGATRELPIGRVVRGRIQSCGCMARQGVEPTHGMKGTPEYSSWHAMKTRCLNPRAKDYPRYGGAGITIHAAWTESFEAFYADVGPRPEGTTLERIDTHGGYVPGNVRWASPREQAENRSNSWTVEILGVLYRSVEQAAKAHRVSNTTIVRWCDGYIDPRRGKRVPAHCDCRRWRTYE